MEWLIPFGLLAAAALVMWRARRAKDRYLARVEYWVYLPEAKLPAQDALMARMVGENPYGRPGRACIGAAEGLLFTDVRTHLGLVRRDKNPTLFRPDLFAERAEPTAEVLAALARAQGMARVRFLSEQPLPDRRHVQFAAHLAGAAMDLGGGLAVFDLVSERLVSAEEFRASLAEDVDASRYEANVRVLWMTGASGGRAATRGMRKVGLPEFQTPDTPHDQRILVSSLLDAYARAAWQRMALPEAFEAEEFGDRFVFVAQPKGDVLEVSIRRVLAHP